MPKAKVTKILITGVSSGLGKALVEEMLVHGKYRVIGIGRTNSLPESDSYKFLKLDLSQSGDYPLDLDPLMKTTIDVFINNAGSAYKGTIEDMDIDSIRKDFEVNYFGPLALIKGLLPQFVKNNTKILNVSALGTYFETPTVGIYASAKLAMKKTLDVLAKETGLEIHHVYLGAVKSAFGRNMKTTANNEHTAIYAEWDNRFRYFFKKRLSAEVAARKVETILRTGNYSEFLTWRDWSIASACRILPQTLGRLLINYYYKNET